MAVDGPNLLVKLVPIEFSEDVDDSPAGYSHGYGIPQFRLNASASIEGKLLFNLGPKDPVPPRLPAF